MLRRLFQCQEALVGVGFIEGEKRDGRNVMKNEIKSEIEATIGNAKGGELSHIKYGCYFTCVQWSQILAALELAEFVVEDKAHQHRPNPRAFDAADAVARIAKESNLLAAYRKAKGEA